MTFWQPLGLLGVLTLWAALALIPWCAAVVATRGRLPLAGLPVVIVAGVAAAALVPAAGAKGASGFWVSLLTASAMGAFVSAGALQQTSRLLRTKRS